MPSCTCKQNKMKGGSLASDNLCHNVDPRAYNFLNQNSTDVFRVNVMRGGSLQRFKDYSLHNQKGGTCENGNIAKTDIPVQIASHIDVASLPLNSPGNSGFIQGAQQYVQNMIRSSDSLPHGVFNTLTAPLSHMQEIQTNVVFPSYYKNYNPGMSGGRRPRVPAPLGKPKRKTAVETASRKKNPKRK